MTSRRQIVGEKHQMTLKIEIRSKSSYNSDQKRDDAKQMQSMPHVQKFEVF
jgi:hypothetical protein